jgi:hypothetical protein
MPLSRRETIYKKSSTVGSTTATNITASANNSTDETVYLTFIDGAAGTQGIETDTGLSYNPSTGIITTTSVTGNLTGNVTGNVTGNTSGTAATVTGGTQASITAAANLVTVGALNSGSITSGFTSINVGSGAITTTGAISGATIDATTDFTIGTTVITDDVITFTPTASDTVTMTAATNGAFSLVTVDNAAAAANIQITADGTVDIDSAGVLTLDSGAAINIEPAAGSAILLDGTISVDAGVITGATSITSTDFVGALTGNATGLSATLAVASGGTGATSLTDKAVLISQDTGTDTVGSVALTTSGQLIIGGSSGPAAATLTAGSNITITNGDGSITIASSGAGTPTAITVADTTDTSSYVALFESATGDLGPKTDTGITYNAGTGILTATGFAGPLTGNVTGNTSGTAATVTTAAQTNITSLGTLTALTVDDVVIDGKVVTMTGSSGDTAVFTVGTNGTLSIVTTDTAAAAANLQITADGTVDIDSAGVLTLDSGAAINIEPAAGSAILLDGTISVDAGVVTGATSITSTAFVGDITGDVTGNTSGTAATVTTAAQGNITSLGTLTTLTVDSVIINGTNIGHTSDTDSMAIASDGVVTFSQIPVLPANSIDSDHYVDGSIDNAHIADDAIDSEHYADGSIDNAHIADDAIDSEHYADGSIDTAHIGDLQVTTAKIAADAVTGAKIADDAIDSEHYTDGSIDNAHIADDAIDSEHYAAGSIDTAHIADNQITLAKLAGGTDGNIISYDASGDPVAIATGSDGQVLTSTGAGSPPAFEALPGSSGVAADDISVGDAAVLITTSSGNITVDAAANDSDIILKGTDGTSDTTFLTIDGSAAGLATFNAGATLGGNLIIPDDGNIGSASDTNSIAISSAGVVTMDQIPVFSAGINVSGGTIAGTLATVAQGNITSLGTLTALTVDDVAIDGKVITMTGSSSDTAVLTVAANGALSLVTTDAAAAAANIQITADGTVDIDSAGVLTLDSGAAINIEPASGSAILLDGTISVDAGVVTGATSITSTAFVGDITGDVTGDASGTAAIATSITAVANNSTDETVYPAFVDGATGTQGIETDTGLTYNPSSGILTTTQLTGNVVGDVTGDVTGTADVATLGTNVTVVANNSTDETVYPAFVDGATGTQGIETDTGLTYNPSSGVLTTTSVTGNLTGDVTGNTSGTAATVTTAAQTNITSLGTLTALTVDDVVIDGKVVTMTGSSSDTAVFTAGTNGTLSIVTTDAAAAAANIQITADGTVDIDSAGVLTLDSGAAINIEPASGSAILLDGTISVDAGVVTGATSITSTAFVGDITGDVTGTADVATVATTVTITDNESTDEDNAIIFTAGGDVDGGNIGLESDGTLTYNPSTGRVTATQLAGTLQTAAQTNITSLGTLTALTVDDVAINGKVITMTGSSSDTAVITAGTNGTLSIVTTDAAAAAANIQITADGTVDIDSAGVLTLDSGAAINIEPASGSAILLDGTISIDAGVVTGATSITSTAFVGDITGDVTGTADVATVATTVTITDNESTNEDNAVVFTAGGDVDGGNIGLESDGTLTYNPSTGRITATQVAGTVVTATQNSITTMTGLTSTGALNAGSITSGFGNIDTGSSTITTTGLISGGSLDIDNVLINGTTIGHTDDTDLMTVADAALTLKGTLTVGVDDTGHDVKLFGASAGAYMEWDESADQLRVMGASADATTSTGKLLLATSLTDINANDVLGKVEFSAPHEGGGTDAITVAASIEAVAQGTFSASVNATDLVFKTGHSEAATEKLRVTSQGELGIGGANYGSDGQVLTSGGAGAAAAWEAAAGGGAWEVVGSSTSEVSLTGGTETIMKAFTSLTITKPFYIFARMRCPDDSSSGSQGKSFGWGYTNSAGTFKVGGDGAYSLAFLYSGGGNTNALGWIFAFPSFDSDYSDDDAQSAFLGSDWFHFRNTNGQSIGPANAESVAGDSSTAYTLPTASPITAINLYGQPHSSGTLYLQDVYIVTLS